MVFLLRDKVDSPGLASLAHPLFRKRKIGVQTNKSNDPLSPAGEERVDERSKVGVSKMARIN